MKLTLKLKTIRFLAPILFPIVKAYWFFVRPLTHGVKVIVTHGDKVLLVKNSYGYKRWTFPGGKIEKGETALAAAERETKEEVGLNLTKTKFIKSFVSTSEYKKDMISIFHGYADTMEINADQFEIEEAAWFSKDFLPELSPVAQKIWEIFLEQSRPI